MKKVAIIQSNYLPWKGYFDIIRKVDVFVFLDDVQYTTRDWRNRNKIKTPEGGTKWISVPVLGGRDQLIREARIDNSRNWPLKHLRALSHSYSKTPHFDRYFPHLEEILEGSYEYLSELNRTLVRRVSNWLGILTEFVASESLNVPGTKEDKLIGILRRIGGTCYLSGPAARRYLAPDKFREAGIDLQYMDYSHYPDYPQISDPFEHGVTVLDLLFMKGEDAPDWIWGESCR